MKRMVHELCSFLVGYDYWLIVNGLLVNLVSVVNY